MRKKLFSLILLLPLLAGCAIPAGLTAKLPFLNRFQTLDCDMIRAGILVGEENDDIAREQMDGYALALQQINNNGGIDGCDLQLFYQTEDESGSTNKTSRQTYQAVRTLVEENKVLALIGGTSSSASMTGASLANYFNVPMLIPSAGGSHILPEENRWGFRLHAQESAYAGLIFELIKQEFGEGVQTAIVFEDSTFGHDAAIAAVNAAKTNDQDVIGYLSYDAAQTNANDLAKQIIELQPQMIYLAFSETAQSENILLALQKEKGSQGIIEIARAGGFASHEFLLNSDEETLAAVEHLILVTRWSGDAESISAGSTDVAFVGGFSEYSRLKYGKAQEPTLYNAEAYKSLMILAETLNSMVHAQAQPTNELQKMREGLRQTLFNYKESSPVWGTIDFSNGGQDQSSVSLLQMFSGEWKVVYPVGKANAELYFDYEPR